ncbi:glycyl-radical enzyme activating protein [Candidatus Epulonipiscium viviparus]|uniref:glycyl-radical enzyme activating protein n=1 Tax=Candidatus Epulonipiscium viviparus TaxID=420336 RepID=UPI00016BFDA7|nr:glycyl-radical enzyme activating protein [Candidatus Epulopiscium viviparus]
MTGIIFNIQRFSTSDGPGIRTTIFFKGCNLRCQWCHNPESYIPTIQLMWNSEQCVSCDACTINCPSSIPHNNRINNQKCQNCGKCVNACLYRALTISGEEKSSDELVALVKKDMIYYKNSGGGLTLSGGEVLLQSDFAADIFKKTKELNIHNSLDTALNVPFHNIKKVLPYTDLVLLDLKLMNSHKHHKYTAVKNELILDNSRRLFDTGIEVHIRVPVIKNINDSIENMHTLLDFIEGYDNVTKVELLPYHDMGINKSNMIGIESTTFEPPLQNCLNELKMLIKTRRS